MVVVAFPASAQELVFAAGEKGGFYQRVAEELTERLGRDGIELRVVTTEGSAENLQRLEEQGERAAHYALSQQDLVAEHFRNAPKSSIRVLDRPFFEYLHILVRTELHLAGAADLGRLRTWPGPPDSGSRFTAIRFLENVGVPRREVLDRLEEIGAVEDGAPESLDDLLDRFKADDVDAAIQVVVAGGSQVICDGFRQRLYRLVSLDYRSLRVLLSSEESREELAETLQERGEERNVPLGQLVVSNLPAETYPGQTDNVQTLAVPVVLLTRGVDTPLASRTRDEVRDIWNELSGRETQPTTAVAGQGNCGVVETAVRGKPLSDAGLPLHAAYEEPIPISTVWTALSWLLLLLLVALIWAAWRWQGHWRIRVASRWLGRRFILTFVLALVFSILVITWGTYWFEHERNENFSNPYESFWSITIFLVSGLEDREPYTTGGRMIATVGLLLGPVTFAVVTGWLAGTFIRWETRLPKNMKDHYLLLNWNSRAQDIIRQLHHPVVTERLGHTSIVALTDDEDLVRLYKANQHGKEDAFEDFLLSIGDPTEERALTSANALDARSIIVLADDSKPGGADEASLRSLMALRKLARERGREDLHVVVEILDFSNDSMIEEIARDFPGELERASGNQIRTFLLAQGALNQGVTFFYRDLLSVSDETNEVYVVPLPADGAGQTFREYARRIFGSEAAEPVIPLGIQRSAGGRKVYLPNPRGDVESSLLKEGDELVVLAYQPPRADDLPKGTKD